MNEWKSLNCDHNDEGRFGHFELNDGIIDYCCACNAKLTTENCHETLGPEEKPVFNYVCEVGDHDGKTWRAFCDECYEVAKKMEADDVCEKYEPSKWEFENEEEEDDEEDKETEL